MSGPSAKSFASAGDNETLHTQVEPPHRTTALTVHFSIAPLGPVGSLLP